MSRSDNFTQSAVIREFPGRHPSDDLIVLVATAMTSEQQARLRALPRLIETETDSDQLQSLAVELTELLEMEQRERLKSPLRLDLVRKPAEY